MSAPVLTESGSDLRFENDQWTLEVRVGSVLDPHSLIHRPTGRVVCDESYCYHFVAAATDGSGYAGPPAELQAVRPLSWRVDAAALVLLGRADLGPTGPTDIDVEHRIELAEDGSVRETLALLHPNGRDTHALSDVRFGFRKTLFDRSAHRWVDDADHARLVPLPLRRYEGQFQDHAHGDYSAAELMPQEWTHGGLPDRSAEAWLWCADGGGVLVSKYDQTHIEFAVAQGEFVRAARSSEGMRLRHLHSDRNLCLRFGGVGVSKGCPEDASRLRPGQRLQFGVSTVQVFTGGVEDGFAAYKTLMRQRGHGLPADYRPRLHWNELYRLGWRCGDNAPLQELPQLWAEADRARRIGAQSFYFDPGWDLFEGSSVWDEARLGPVGDFVDRLRADYGLGLALHVMMHTKSCDDDPRIYRRRPDGNIDVWSDSTPYAGGYVCPASPRWQRLKTDRLRALVDAGVRFLMFDFLSYDRAVVRRLDDGDYRGSCWSPDHGHSVPLTREEHADGVMTVVRALKEHCPELSIEAHDRIGGEFLPLYYQHDAVRAHDELWGFEYMWDPYADLLSGKALSLYEYNLAYDIPLYLHINSAHDSPTLLAFWWYASTCRHLGIGGLDPSDDAWAGYATAVSHYLRLQDVLAAGRFVGLDRLTHLHVAADGRSGVLLAFNLTATAQRRTAVIDAADFAGRPRMHAARVCEKGLEVDLDLPPLSPLVLEVTVE